MDERRSVHGQIKRGTRFGRLIVSQRWGFRSVGKKVKTKRQVWRCSCLCGKTVYVTQISLVTGTTKSCGCLRSDTLRQRRISGAHDWTGKVYKKLTVLHRSSRKRSDGKTQWYCQCDCGNYTYAVATSTTNLCKTSCGCNTSRLKSIAKTKHGGAVRGAKDPIYAIWISAKFRAKKQNVPFKIEFLEFKEWALRLLSFRNYMCPVLSIKMVHNISVRKYNSVTLDRRRPVLGYVRGNIDLISHRANQLKNDATFEEIMCLVKYFRNA